MNNNPIPIVFLDQFAFNKIAKSFYNSSTKQKDEDSFWQELYHCMVDLAQSKKCKFPWSPFREEETLTFDEFNKIEEVKYKITSGLLFKAPDDIFIEQVHEYIKAWMNDEKFKVSLKTGSILETIHDKNAWTNQQPAKDTNDWVRLRNNTISSRKNVNNNILQSEEILDASIFSSEKGDKAIRLYVDNRHNKYLERIKDIQNNYLQFNKILQLGDSLHNEYLSKNIPGTTLYAAINFIRFLFIGRSIANITGNKNLFHLNKQVTNFLDSEHFKALPILKVEYYLYALLARKVYNGQKKLNNIHTDFESIANYLPYCDAMFIDNECAGLLCEKIIITDLAYNAHIFSTKRKEEFLRYLKQLI